MGPAARAEWESIHRGTNPELYFEEVLAFAARQESEQRLELAAEVYAQLLREAGDYPAVLRRARERLDAVEGRGNWAPRAEFLLRRLAQESSEPTALFAMGAAGAAFRVTRLAALSRLSAAPTANFLTRGFGARAISGLAGFAVEAPTFTLAGRLAGTALGREQDWSLRVLGRDLASSFLVLGGLKLAGWGAGAAYRGVSGTAGTRSFQPLRALFQQSGMFAGILLGHGMEAWTGLRRPVDGATTLVDSLAMLLQFNVAGRLVHAASGPRLRAWESGLQIQTDVLERGLPRPRPPALGGFGPRPASAAAGAFAASPPRAAARPLELPVVFMTGSQEGKGSEVRVPISGVREAEAVPPEYRVEYPPEIEALVTEAEATMRRPDYFEGDRAELRAKRPSLEAIDRIWFHQALDLFHRIDYVQSRMGGAELLLEPLPGIERAPEADLLMRAIARLERSADGPRAVSLQVLEVRFPRDKLTEFFLSHGRPLENSLATLSSLIEAQGRLEGRVHLAKVEGDEFIGRLPSVSLWEAILQEAFGEANAQVHPVEGAVARDHIMALRRRRVFPMGFSRDSLVLGDIGQMVHPTAFAIHDGYFHGAIDAASRPGYLEFSGRSYDWLQRNVSSSSTREAWLDRLSDGELGISHDMLTRALPKELRARLSETEAALRALPPSEEVAVRRAEVRGLAEELGRLMRDGAPSRELNAEEAEALRQWEEFLTGLREPSVSLAPAAPEIVEAPRFEYPPEIERIWDRLEARFADPDYFRGDRGELLARRPAWEDIDALWHFQGQDYARRVPGARHDFVDAETLRDNPPYFEGEADPALMPSVLRLMGERGRPGHPSRRVLRVFIPEAFLYSDAYIPGNRPLKYLSVIPPLIEVDTHLNRRLGLVSRAEGGLYFHFPTLSLLQGLYQGVHGPASVEVFPVPGEISRDTAARLRSLRLPPVGFVRGLIYLGDAEVEVHPFSFSGHDAVFHVGRDASLPDPVPEVSGRFYSRLVRELPPHPAGEEILNNLSDLQFDGRGMSLHKRFHALFTRALQKAADAAGKLPEPERDRALAGLRPLAEALRGFAIAEYREHPELRGKERFLLGALRRYGRNP